MWWDHFLACGCAVFHADSLCRARHFRFLSSILVFTVLLRSGSTHLHSAMPVAYGGVSRDVVAGDARKKQQLLSALPAKNWALTGRQLSDIELIINGGFSSLDGFLDDDDYLSVVNSSRLANGLQWTIPITLDVQQQSASATAVGDRIALPQDNSTPIGVLTVQSIYQSDKKLEASNVFRGDPEHPGIH